LLELGGERRVLRERRPERFGRDPYAGAHGGRHDGGGARLARQDRELAHEDGGAQRGEGAQVLPRQHSHAARGERVGRVRGLVLADELLAGRESDPRRGSAEARACLVIQQEERPEIECLWHAPSLAGANSERHSRNSPRHALMTPIGGSSANDSWLASLPTSLRW